MKYFHFLLFFFCFSSVAVAQTSRGQQLYDEGLELQKIQTVKSQNSAIDYFKRAKVAFNEVEKKNNCERQIGVCKNNIQRIRVEARKKSERLTPGETTDKKSEEIANIPVSNQPVEISLSPVQIKFKYKPKANQTIFVKCNYEDWEVVAYPEWLKVYAAPNEISIIPEENNGDERTGMLTVRCHEKTVEVEIIQSPVKGIKKLLKKIKGD